ncbi:MAG: putative zinc-binding peptidase [Acidiferrobacteraceae bacterium]
MKTFRCTCGNTLQFENYRCLVCGRTLGFLPDHGVLSALEQDQGYWKALNPIASDARYRQCRNYAEENVCNWMVRLEDGNAYCVSCRLNHVIPDLSEPHNKVLWARIERAKRRLVYTLLSLGLPIVGRDADPVRGLAFEFLADTPSDTEFTDEISPQERVMTGHRAGLITINIAEADPGTREDIREKMNEAYRTLLGHFRHEIGHFYWMRLVENTDWIAPARELFGDERQDYAAALARYYQGGPPASWSEHFISPYAASHPWEDWAETWAHYLHIVDTLETAHDFGFSMRGKPVTSPHEVLDREVQYAYGMNVRRATFANLLEDWVQLTVALNSLNRSMGLRDPYPFALSPGAAQKLGFIHQLVQDSVTD